MCRSARRRATTDPAGSGRRSILQQPAAATRGVCRGGDGIARSTLDAFVELARDRCRSAPGALRDNQSDPVRSPRPRRGSPAARLSVARALEEITGAVARAGHITLDQRMEIRLASTFAIHQSLQVVDAAYHAAGSTAIFEENPFERRFRDIHTVSQQLQGRAEHFETVGQYLLGIEPGSTMWL